jgi:hypothetical protein
MILKFGFGYNDGSEPMFRPMYGKERILLPASYLFAWTMIVIALLVVIAGFFVPAASAQNMTITDLGVVGRQTVQVYAMNGTILVGTYNTTTAGIALPKEDFVLLVKPDTTSVISDPAALLAAAFGAVQANVIPIVIILFFIGVVFRR